MAVPRAKLIKFKQERFFFEVRSFFNLDEISFMLDKNFQRGYFIRRFYTGFRFNNFMTPNMSSVFNKNNICWFFKSSIYWIYVNFSVAKLHCPVPEQAPVRQAPSSFDNSCYGSTCTFYFISMTRQRLGVGLY